MICSKYGLLTSPNLTDFLQEKLITLVPFSIAVFAITKYSESLTWIIIYLGIIGFHMTHIILQRCPHCAYYHRQTRWLECLWMRWIPKIRKPQKDPPPKYLKIYTPIAIMIITFYPIYFLINQWELFVFYVLSWGVLFLSISTSACARCIEFGCKYNSVSEELRKEYLATKTEENIW